MTNLTTVGINQDVYNARWFFDHHDNLFILNIDMVSNH